LAPRLKHWGSVSELAGIIELLRPGLHLFGHVHESNGVAAYPGTGTLCVNGGNANWPGEPEAKKRKRVMNRLAFPARLLRAEKLDSKQRWQFSVVQEISLEAASLAGWK